MITFQRVYAWWPWLAFAYLGLLAFLALIIGFPIVALILIFAEAALVWFLIERALRRRRFVDSFNISVRHAIGQLVKSGTWVDLCNRTGLSVRDTDVVRVPSITAIRPIPSGAEICVKPLVGQSVSDFERSGSAMELALAVPRVRVRSGPPGQVAITLATVDPLARRYEMRFPPKCSADLRRLPLGIDESGRWVWLSLADTSGWVVGGVPGSGKTSALSVWLASLGVNPLCQLAIFDGKGGGDWSSWASRAFLYCDTDNLGEAVEAFSSVYRLLQLRLQAAAAVLNHSNVWAAGFRPSWPSAVVLVDECQTYFDTTGMDKADRALSAEISRIVSSLIRRGCSAGIITVLATQKPTTDSIPSSARDNASLRTCFAVTTDEAAVSVLGAAIRGSDESPVHLRLPSARGVCTMPLNAGGFGRIRVPYLAPETVARYVGEAARWRRDPLECLRHSQLDQR